VKVATLPCLAHSNFHLFLHLKNRPSCQKFHEDEEMKNEVTTRLRAQAEKFCDIGIQKLVPRLNKYLDKGGDHVEKLLKVSVEIFSLNFVNNCF
jgi:hypothetical protein